MYPPRRSSELSAGPSRRIPINLDGEVIEMDWDGPGNPTKADVRAWVQKKREHPIAPVTPTTPAPVVPGNKPEGEKSLLSSAGDFISGLAAPVTNMFHQVNETGRGAFEDIKAGNYPQAFQRLISPVMPTEQVLNQAFGKPPTQSEAGEQALSMVGVPATQMKEAYQKGEYAKLAGQTLGTAAALYGPHAIGKRLAARGTPEPEFVPKPTPKAGPVIPEPAMPEPVQQTLLEQPNLFETQAQGPKEPPGSVHIPKRQVTQVGPEQPSLFGEPQNQATLEFGDDPVLQTAAKSPIPEVADAARKVSKLRQMKEAAENSSFARVLADMGKSGMSVLRDSGESGKKLAKLLTKTRLDSDYQAGDWITRAKEITKDLSPEQISAYVEARDTGHLPSDPAVIAALEARKLLDQEVVKATQESGAGYKTADGKKIVPFRERLNYWPHIYPKEFFKNTGTAIESLMKDGMSYEEAASALKNSSRFGERLISPQHQRQTNAPGYRLDLEADYLHLNDMARRVTEAREFGPLDTADPKSPISQLIAGTNEPGRIGKLVSRHLGREEPPDSWWAKSNRALTTAETAMHLSQFVISNMSQLATVPLRSNAGAYVKSLAKTLGKFKSAESEAEGTGALQTIHQDLLREVGGEGFMSKVYGMKRSETFNRTVAALSGKGTAQDLFAQLKKNPTNARAKARLENLLLEPVDSVMKQTELTPQQLGRAGGRMAEITQGRAQAIDLPKLWSDHPALELLLLYKKYAFRQTQIIKDAIMENPTRNLPMALALYTAMGEGVGDLKAGVRGSVSGQGASQAIASRGEDVGEMLTGAGFDPQSSKVVGRIASNLGQSWALGLLADALESSSRGQVGLLKFGAGPVLGDVTEILGAAGTGDAKALGKKAASTVPFVGSGLAARMNDEKKKRGTMFLTLPSAPKLPKLPMPEY